MPLQFPVSDVGSKSVPVFRQAGSPSIMAIVYSMPCSGDLNVGKNTPPASLKKEQLYQREDVLSSGHILLPKRKGVLMAKHVNY